MLITSEDDAHQRDTALQFSQQRRDSQLGVYPFPGRPMPHLSRKQLVTGQVTPYPLLSKKSRHLERGMPGTEQRHKGGDHIRGA